MSNIIVALGAIRTDAELWRAQATAMDQPKKVLPSLELMDEELSKFSVDAGLNASIEDLTNSIGNLFGQGMEYFRGLADDLCAAADQYQADDEAGKAAIEEASAHHRAN